MSKVKVLLIEDDPMVREVNRQFIERVEGFHVIDMASNGIEGLRKIKELQPHLVFMDVFMPEQDGIDTLREIRKQQIALDCISVTAANDMQTIQTILHLGVYDYIMKPFTFERMEQTLLNYRQFKLKMNNAQGMTQQELDDMMYQVRETAEFPARQVSSSIDLPKGFNRATMEKVLQFLKQQNTGVSADEVATGMGVARVTARRYLDYMEKSQQIRVDIQYGSVGRPINQYFI